MSKQSYFDHDFRGAGPSRSKQLYVPPGPMGRQRKFRNNKPRFQDLDGDVDMMPHQAEMDKRRFNPYGGSHRNNNRKKYNNRNGGKSRHGGDPENSWHKVVIPYGKKIGKEFIMKSINSLCKSPFVPINFQFNNTVAEFYVSSRVLANQIREVNRRVTTPDGFKMAVTVNRCPQPVTTIERESLKIIEECMSSHYDAMTHVLDLTRLYRDSRLFSAGIYAPLNKPNVFHAVVRIIKERIPEIEVLNLTDNKLYTIDPLSSLVPACKQLKSLILKNNKIKNADDLNSIKGMEIIELVLDGNPLCDEFKSKNSYISAARERFPRLLSLDGHQLPPPIGFDLGVETCPESKKCFFAESGNSTHKDLVIQFLDQYYTIYDSGDRSRLLDAYHDQANFSLSLARHSHKNSGGCLSAYYHDNRNLLKVTETEQRFKLLKQGKLSIVSTLSEMPQTMHDPTSFSVDIFHLSPSLMSFAVTGVFKEVGADINNAVLKTFNRTFIVVPHSSSIAIINETLYIAPANQDQQEKAFKVPAPTPSPSPAPSTEEKNPVEKQMMVLELTKQTGMNLDFSTKCLEEHDWDYQRAVAVFMKFQSEGKIPPEAFIKTEQL